MSKPFETEIIEDSEPEREALRTLVKASRKIAKSTASQHSSQSEKGVKDGWCNPMKASEIQKGSANLPDPKLSDHHAVCSGVIIDIDTSLEMAPDDPYEDLECGHSTKQSDAVEVIDISDDSCVSVSKSVASDKQQQRFCEEGVFPGDSALYQSSNSSSSALLRSINPDPREETHQPAPKEISSVQRDAESWSGRRLDLQKFVCPSATSRVPRPPILRQSSIPALPQPTRKTKSVTRKHIFSNDFQDTDLTKLIKCVSCDARWTTRKTAKEKVAHIQKCAKKNNITEDTLRILIRREIDSFVAPVKGKGKGKEKDTTPTDPVTLYEHLVGDPNHRTKRAKTAATVTNADAERLRILKSARNIIGNLDNSQDYSIRTQALGSNNPDEAGPPLTQPFGGSRLKALQDLYSGNGDSSGQAIVNTLQNDEAELGPTDEHMFAPSRLNLYGVVVGPNAHPPHLSSENENSQRNQIRSQVVNDDLLTHTEDNIGRQGLAAIANHPHQPPHESSPQSNLNIITNHSDDPRPKPTKRRKKQKDLEDDVDWENTMKEKIMSDEGLHLRILRYEPIHFDVFVALTGAEPTGNLKLRLRKLLDELGINAYGATGVGRRR